MSDIEEKVKDIIAEELGVERDKVTPAADGTRSPGAKSAPRQSPIPTQPTIRTVFEGRAAAAEVLS